MGMPIDFAKAIPTLVGSLLSCLATSTVLVLYIVLRKSQQSFRHALILNLTLAEFINSLNNSISGIYMLANHGHLTSGPACAFNGWVGQWSVQAVDFSILAIAVVTLLTVTHKTYMPNISILTKFFVCVSTWIVPTITSSIAAGLHKLNPVSGNWCWIDAEPIYLRYALGHGWRFGVIVTTICLYIYIWIIVRRHYTKLRFFHLPFPISTSPSSSNVHRLRFGDEFNTTPFSLDERLSPPLFFSKVQCITGPAILAKQAQETVCLEELPEHLSIARAHKSESASSSAQSLAQAKPSSISASAVLETNRRQREVQLTLLLNAYPLFYILLWIPGLINRVFEASGHPNRILSLLQCTTQYVGLANAITYGFDQHLRRNIDLHMARWKSKVWTAI